MTLTRQTPNGELPVSDAVVEQVIRYAECAADLAGATLAAVSDFDRDHQLPAAAILELAAVVQLQIWEERKTFASWPPDLPTFDVARQDFINRTKNGPSEFSSLEKATLSMQVMRFQLTRLAWDSSSMGNCNLFITIDNEDAFIEAMAQFLFDNRASIDVLISKD